MRGECVCSFPAALLASTLGVLFGGELLVRGESQLAAIAKIPPLVIGLTVVAFGTSSPELAVSVKSALSGNADIALGNVVGSNIFNVLFILGTSALLVPLVVSSRLVRLDVPLMIAASLSVLLLGFDGAISRVDGVAAMIEHWLNRRHCCKSERPKPVARQSKSSPQFASRSSPVRLPTRFAAASPALQK